MGSLFAVYVELERPMDSGEFARALAGEHVEIMVSAEDSPTNVNAAGQNDILVSLRPDAQHENGFWIWTTADNLRLLATSALECAENIAVARPRGKVQ